VEIARSSGRQDFDGASLNTVKREWRFRAARRAGGDPVEAIVFVTIRFELNS
jgi:outer membrane biosynthesis protein TonB